MGRVAYASYLFARQTRGRTEDLHQACTSLSSIFAYTILSHNTRYPGAVPLTASTTMAEEHPQSPVPEMQEDVAGSEGSEQLETHPEEPEAEEHEVHEAASVTEGASSVDEKPAEEGAADGHVEESVADAADNTTTVPAAAEDATPASSAVEEAAPPPIEEMAKENIKETPASPTSKKPTAKPSINVKPSRPASGTAATPLVKKVRLSLSMPQHAC